MEESELELKRGKTFKGCVLPRDRYMTNELSSIEGSRNNWRIFVYPKRVRKFGARAELLETLEGTPKTITFSFPTFALKCSAFLQDNLDSIGLKFAPILVSSGRLGLHDLEEIRKCHPDSRWTQSHTMTQGLEKGAQAESSNPYHPSADLLVQCTPWATVHSIQLGAQGTHMSLSGLQGKGSRTRMLDRKEEAVDKFRNYFLVRITFIV